MKRVLAATAAVLLLASPLARAAEGADLFAQKCASCHGPDGKGKTKMGEMMKVPDLTASKESQADVEKTITNGKGKMTAYKDKLSPEQIKAVAAHVKSLK